MSSMTESNNEKSKRIFKPVPLLDGIEEIRQDFEERIAQGDVVYGIEILDDCVETIRKGSITFLIARANVGKALSLDTKILTPKGWIKNKDIKIGDYVIGRDGQPTRVLGVFPQGITDTYKVIFNDGREVITNPEHLWAIDSCYYKEPKVLTTKEIGRLLKSKHYRSRLYTPSYSGNHGINKELPIHPYVLGVLLGDGCLTQLTPLCNISKYFKPNKEIAKKISEHYQIKEYSKDGLYGICDSSIVKYLCKKKLNTQSYNKYIPEEYLQGTSKEQRLELLQGLLDTDGSQCKSYNEFSTTSERLAKDIQQLSWSLGYDCRVHERIGKYKKGEQTIQTRKSYRVIISNKRTKAQSIIKEVIPYKKMETQCIAVDAADKLFVIENYIVTHNSNVAQIIALNLAKQGKKVLICSCEMGAGLLMERQLRRMTGIGSKQLRELYEKSRDKANYILDSVFDSKFDYLHNVDICETGGATVDDIIAMLDCFPEYHFIIIDYIQRIRGQGKEYEVITNAARELQTYARRTGKAMIICSQANRASESDGKKDTMAIRGKGSGSIEEDADVGLSLMEEYEGDNKYILATLFKNRYGALKNITYKYSYDGRLNLVLQERGYAGG